MNLLSDISYKMLAEYLEHDDRIFLPLGATEDHCPHMGLGTDFYEVEAIAHGTAKVTDVIAATTLHYGQSQYMMEFLNGHGGNTVSISSAIKTANGLTVKLFQWWIHPEVNQLVENLMGKQLVSHAAFAETALMRAIQPQAVKMDYLTGNEAFVTEGMVITAENFKQHSPDGNIGRDPSGATTEAGELILEKSIEVCVRELENW